MIKIKMLKDANGTDDGKFIQQFKKGMTYLVGSDLGNKFVERGVAESLEDKSDLEGGAAHLEAPKEDEMDENATYLLDRGEFIKVNEEPKEGVEGANGEEIPQIPVNKPPFEGPDAKPLVIKEAEARDGKKYSGTAPAVERRGLDNPPAEAPDHDDTTDNGQTPTKEPVAKEPTATKSQPEAPENKAMVSDDYDNKSTPTTSKKKGK